MITILLILLYLLIGLAAYQKAKKDGVLKDASAGKRAAVLIVSLLFMVPIMAALFLFGVVVGAWRFVVKLESKL